MSRSLAGAVAAIVGASGGLGTPIARQLADRGAQLVLAGPHVDRLSALDIDGAVAIELDVRDPHAGDALAALAMERFGRLDGLVNAAGVVAFGALVDTDDTVIEELFLTNAIGPLWLIKRIVPLLVESRGFIVNLSAVVAEHPMANMAPYSATKAALTAADTALGRELRRAGIQVCDVRPPHTETGLAQRPLAGSAPALPAGLAPELVATLVVDAIVMGSTALPSRSFAPDATSSPGPASPVSR
ncbi:MAG: SDR family NAD(P)-dependent oxidoreductase [Microthrixaceae bacterium]